MLCLVVLLAGGLDLKQAQLLAGDGAFGVRPSVRGRWWCSKGSKRKCLSRLSQPQQPSARHQIAETSKCLRHKGILPVTFTVFATCNSINYTILCNVRPLSTG